MQQNKVVTPVFYQLYLAGALISMSINFGYLQSYVFQ